MIDKKMKEKTKIIIEHYNVALFNTVIFVKPRFEYNEDKEKLLELRKQLNYKVGE